MKTYTNIITLTVSLFFFVTSKKLLHRYYSFYSVCFIKINCTQVVKFLSLFKEINCFKLYYDI